MPLPAPSSSWTSKTIMAAASAELTPSKMEAAEIEMLCDDDEAEISRTYDGRPFCVRRKRCILVCMVLLLLVIGVAVTGITIYGRNNDEESTKPSKQEDNTNDAELPPDHDEVDTTSTNTPPPTPSIRITPHPTAIRTSRPTTSPTKSPTPFPTQSPTVSPTRQPTKYPTVPAETPEPTTFPVAEAQPTGAPPTAEPPTNPITMSPTFESETPEPAGGDYTDWYNAQVTLNDGPMFEIIDQLPHDANAFTQGLTLAPDGRLFESTGLNGQSSIRQLDPHTGDVLEKVPLDAQYFGEGLAFAHDQLVQITWKKATALVWNADNLQEPPVTKRYQTSKRNEGWGITHNPITNEFIVSDGSNNLVYWNVDTLETLRTIPVTRLDGSAAKNMNELEFWRGRVLANVWFEEVILVIHPDTGVVEKEYDFSSLWPASDRPSGTNVFNGISISDDDDILYVTGKKWNRMYKVRLLP